MTTKIKSGVISDNAITSAHISSGAISSSHLTGIDTDAVSEGSSNLYFTTARVDSHLSGGTGVTYSSGAISIGQSVATTDSPTFANLTLTGNLNITGDVDSVSVTDLDVTDKTITVGVGGTASANDGAGLVVDGASASILWDNSNTSWDFNKGINVITDSTGGFKIETAADAAAGVDLTTFQGSTNSNVRNFNIHSQNFTVSTGAPTGTSTTKALTIDNSQNVGIGETAPLGKLHVRTADSGGSVNVNGNQLVLENSGSAGLSILSGTTGDGNIFLGDSGNNIAGVLQYSHNGDSFRISSTGQLLLQTGGANTRLKIDSSGNVGIGTTSPSGITNSKVLEIKNTSTGTGTHAQITLTGSNGHTNLLLASGDDSTGGDPVLSSTANHAIRFGHSTDSTFSGFDEHMRITDGGNVGIGTNNPSQLLEISGADAPSIRLNDTTYSQYAEISTANAGSLILKADVGNGGTGSTYIGFEVDGASEAMRIDSAGDLLVGSITNLNVLSGTPKIQVGDGSGHSSIQWYSGTGSVAGLYFGDATSGTGRYSGYIEYRHNNDSMAFRTGGGERVSIDSTGNVDVSTGRIKVINSGTDAYFFEGVRDGGNVTLRMYDNNNNLYIDSYTNMSLRCNQTGGGSGGQIYLSGGDVNIGNSSDSARYLIFDKTTSGENGIIFRNATSNKGKILLNANEELKFYINNTTDAMTINETSTGGATTIPGVQIGNLSHGWGNLAVTADDSSWDGGITIAAASTGGGSGGYGALFWKQGGIAQGDTKWFMGFTNSTSTGSAYDDLILGAYQLNTGYSRGGRTDGVMHFDRSNGDVHVAKQVNFHGQEGFKVYNTSGFSKGTNWEHIGDSITTVDYNGGGWSSSNGRFTPTKAGYYLFTFGGYSTANSDGSRYATCFRHSTTGLRYISGGDYTSVDSPLNGHSEVIYMNGSTDYVELYAYSSLATTWGGSSHAVWWGAEFLH